MDIIYTDKCRYEIQEQKEVPVWYPGTYRSILSITTTTVKIYNKQTTGMFRVISAYRQSKCLHLYIITLILKIQS
jgi:hypothetical protein